MDIERRSKNTTIWITVFSFIFLLLVVTIKMLFSKIENEILIVSAENTSVANLESIEKLVSQSSTLSWLLLVAIIVTIGSIVFTLAQQRSHKTVEEKAYVDKLTGVYNRHYLQAFFENQDIRDFVFTQIDIDHFKKINDTYGHDMGDLVLKQMSDALKKAVRTSGKDKVIRMGGEEFIILLEHNNNLEGVIATIERIHRKIKALEFITKENVSFNITASFGVNVAFRTNVSVEDAIKKSDLALYRAKIDRDSIEYFNEKNAQEFEINYKKIKSMIESGGLLCYYQPIIDFGTNKIIKYEALVRLKDSDGTVYTPGHFIHAIEDQEIKESMVKSLFSYNSKMMREKPGIVISVNLSVKELMDNNIFAFLIEFSHTNSIVASNIEIEVVGVDDADDIVKLEHLFQSLKKCGYKISIDDFGDRYSRILHLLDLIDELKIDGAIVKSLKSSDHQMGHIHSIIRLAKTHGVKVTAEHVETKEVEQVLRSLGVDYGQGFYIGRPAVM